MPEPRNPRVEDLERAAALHWQAPETEPLGEWRLRAAAGFTGRANSALPLGDPGLPLPEAVAAVEAWYRRRDLPPMIVLPQGAGPDPLPAYLAERSWVPRPGPAFVMTAEIADLPAGPADVRFSPEPDAAFLGLYRYRGRPAADRADADDVGPVAGVRDHRPGTAARWPAAGYPWPVTSGC